jgi:hypothetical protein
LIINSKDFDYEAIVFGAVPDNTKKCYNKDSMRKSRFSKKIQDRLIEHFVAGTTARCAAELIGVNRKTAAYYYQRLRVLIASQAKQAEHEVFDGEIEVDESYFEDHHSDICANLMVYQNTILSYF